MYACTAEEKQTVQRVLSAKTAARNIQKKIWQIITAMKYGNRQQKHIRKNMTAAVPIVLMEKPIIGKTVIVVSEDMTVSIKVEAQPVRRRQFVIFAILSMEK